MARAGVAGARAFYAELGTSVFELLWLAGAGEARRQRAIADHVVLDEAGLDVAGPIVLAASHTGHWELAAFATARFFAARGRTFTVVAKPIAVGAFHVFCNRLREAAGVRVVPPAGALEATQAALASGGVVAMLIDQVPDRERHAERGSFLGAPALLDRAPFALAARAKATVLVVASRREGARQVASVLAELEARTPAAAAREAAGVLERFVRAHPTSWLWLHRRWREPRPLASAPAATRSLAS